MKNNMTNDMTNGNPVKLILLFLKLQNSNAGAASTNFFTSLYLLPK